MEQFQIILFFCLLVSICGTVTVAKAKDLGEALVYFGTYTTKASKGIYVSRMDLTTGELSAPQLAVETTSPDFLAIHPNGKFLYSVGELNPSQLEAGGAVKAFSIDPKSGKLRFLNQQSSGGRIPCHLIVDKKGRHVLVANYITGNAFVLPVQSDGQLKPAVASVQHTGSSVNPTRQKQPYAHSINLDPANKFAFVADLGIDKVMIYKFSAAKGTLTANEISYVPVHPGAGPRHFTFHPNGRFAYVINEIDCTVTAFRFKKSTGELSELQSISTLPQGVAVEPRFSTAEIQMHPSGKFLYGSNRGHDSIAVFSIDQRNGKLARIQNEPSQGKTPRNFCIDPTGRFLLAANEDSDNVVVFRIAPKDGRLTPAGNQIDVPTPVCVKFLKPKF